MKRYYLVTFSWVGGSSKVEECKLYDNMEDPLQEVANANIIKRDADEWISDQIKAIKKSECSVPFKCNDGLYRVLVTPDYPEKAKSWKHIHDLFEVLCAAVIEAERGIKIDNILKLN